jgi:carbon storage regulator CsrA
MQEAQGSLVLTRKRNQVVHVGSDVEVHVVKISGNAVQLRFVAPRRLMVVRGEIRNGRRGNSGRQGLEA